MTASETIGPGDVFVPIFVAGRLKGPIAYTVSLDTGVTLTASEGTIVPGDALVFRTWEAPRPAPVGNRLARRTELARRRTELARRRRSR